MMASYIYMFLLPGILASRNTIHWIILGYPHWNDMYKLLAKAIYNNWARTAWKFLKKYEIGINKKKKLVGMSYGVGFEKHWLLSVKDWIWNLNFEFLEFRDWFSSLNVFGKNIFTIDETNVLSTAEPFYFVFLCTLMRLYVVN